MSAIGFVRKALAMGVDLETALAMGEAFEAAHPVYVAPVGIVADPTMERRRAYDRERQAERRAAEKAAKAASTGHPPTSAESAASTGHPPQPESAKDAPAPAHTRGENNLSRLEVTGLAAAVADDGREPACDWPSGDAKHHADLLAQAASSPRLDPAKQPGLATTLGRLAAWKRDGASWTYDVVPAVTIMSQKRGPPIGTWKYFDGAIAQSIADNRQALTIPPANGNRHERPDQPSAKFAAKQANMDRSFRAAQRVAGRGAV